MPRRAESQSPNSEAVVEYYASGFEAARLRSDAGKIEGERSRELLKRFLPPAPATILDVGGGPGGYACWLAEQGYTVHLIDLSPLHVQLAEEASRSRPDAPLASASVGDACALSWEADPVDAVLLLGPLYHLTDREDRLQALREAHRVLKAGGVLLAAGISRFALLFDGLRRGLLRDPLIAQLAEDDFTTGHHKNPTGKWEFFMETFFHLPDELRSEVALGGFTVTGVYGIEGPTWLLPDLDAWWEDAELRERLLRIARNVEAEPSLLGVSAHLLAVAKK
jgi:SAM-dependent methyltransferase